MTIKAREVLEDCRGALAEMTDGVQGPVWRRRWITAVTLLRTVGNVLENVDRNRSVEIAGAIDTAYESLKNSKPNPAIYWEFIYGFRNQILKQYNINAGQDVNINLGSEPIAVYSYPIINGSFIGRDQREVIREAIEWWEEYLDSIDKEAS